MRGKGTSSDRGFIVCVSDIVIGLRTQVRETITTVPDAQSVTVEANPNRIGLQVTATSSSVLWFRKGRSGNQFFFNSGQGEGRHQTNIIHVSTHGQLPIEEIRLQASGGAVEMVIHEYIVEPADMAKIMRLGI